MWVDSHCHLNRLSDFASHQAVPYLVRARQAGVRRFLCVAVQPSDWPELVQLAQSHSDVDITVGIHPLDIPNPIAQSPEGADPAADQIWSAYQAYLADPAVRAAGEMGLDFYRVDDPVVHHQQTTAFRRQLELAVAAGKPVVIHTRQSAEATLDILSEPAFQSVTGVLHCFTENWEIARRALDRGLYISLSGIVTFKNATTVQEVAKRVPLDRLLIETDAPYLAPHPHRGQPNEPMWIQHVGVAIAHLRQIAVETVAAHTVANYERLMGPPRSGIAAAENG